MGVRGAMGLSKEFSQKKEIRSLVAHGACSCRYVVGKSRHRAHKITDSWWKANESLNRGRLGRATLVPGPPRRRCIPFTRVHFFESAFVVNNTRNASARIHAPARAPRRGGDIGWAPRAAARKGPVSSRDVSRTNPSRRGVGHGALGVLGVRVHLHSPSGGGRTPRGARGRINV